MAEAAHGRGALHHIGQAVAVRRMAVVAGGDGRAVVMDFRVRLPVLPSTICGQEQCYLGVSEAPTCLVASKPLVRMTR